MANNININVNLLLENAVKTLESFSSTTKKQLSGIEKEFTKTNGAIEASFNTLKKVATAAIGGITFAHIVESGLEAQGALDKLGDTLRFLGDDTPVEAFEQLAEEIQLLTGANDEFILSQAAMLKSLGATNDQVDQTIRVASELSTALNQDLGTSVNQLVQIFNGSLPRGLGRAIPELKRFIKDGVLDGAAAVDFLQGKLGGLSEAASGSVAIRFLVLKQSLSNVVEEFGKIIVNSPAFISLLNGAISVASGLAVALKSVSFTDILSALTRIGALAFEFLVLPKIFALVSGAISFITINLDIMRARGLLSLTSLKVGFSGLVQSINFAKIALNLLKASATLGLTILVDQFIEASFATTSFGDALAVVGLKIKKLFIGILSTVISAFEGIFRLFGAFNGKFKKDFERAFGDAKKTVNEFSVSAQKDIDKITLKKQIEEAEKLKKSLKEFKGKGKGLSPEEQAQEDKQQEIKKSQEAAFQSLGIGEIGRGAFNLLGFDPAKLTEPLSETERQIKGFASAIGKGADGAKEAVAGTLKGVAVGLLGPLGQALGPLVDVLAQGPEQTKKFITEFLNNIPVILENILKAVPALLVSIIENLPSLVGGIIQAVGEGIASIVEALPTIIESLIENAPRILEEIIVRIPLLISKILESLPRVGIELALQMPFVAQRMAIEFIKNIPRMVSEIGKGILDSIKNAFGSIFGGGGEGGGGILSNIPIIGGLFAQGGLVPEGFPNDSFPARLTSGELVIDRSTTGRLLNFLDRAEAFTQSQAPQAQQQSGQSQTLTINNVISEEVISRVILDLNRRGFRLA